MVETNEPEILVFPFSVEYTQSGFPFVSVADDCRIYIPQDRRVRHLYAIKGSLTKGEKAYVIKKGSQNLVYGVQIEIIHYFSIVENITLSATGDIINVLNYDALSIPLHICKSNIVKVVEVSPNSTIQVEFTVEDLHYTISYKPDKYEIKKEVLK